MDILPTIEGYTTSFNDLFNRVIFSSNEDNWNFAYSEQEIKKLQSIDGGMDYLSQNLAQRHEYAIYSRKDKPATTACELLGAINQSAYEFEAPKH